eukprot:15478560-Alexandrium_andersonii.AAC.1
MSPWRPPTLPQGPPLRTLRRVAQLVRQPRGEGNAKHSRVRLDLALRLGHQLGGPCPDSGSRPKLQTPHW